jgi:O-antigen/teichoic acid export membrane protein
VLAIVLLLNEQIALYFLKDASMTSIVIAGIFYLAMSFFTVFSFIMLGLQNFKLFSLTQFLNAASSAILAVLLSPFGLFYMIIGWGMGPLIANLPNIAYMLKKKMFSKCVKTDYRKVFMSFTLPIYPVEVVMNMFNVIIPLLSLFFSQTLIGYYSFAFMFYFVAQMIPMSLAQVLFPKISELNGQGRHVHAKEILRKSFTYYGAIAAVGIILTLLLSDWFVGTIASQYISSITLFKTILSLSFIFGFNVIYSNYLKGIGKIRTYALLSLVQNILLIAISFVLLSQL